MGDNAPEDSGWQSMSGPYYGPRVDRIFLDNSMLWSFPRSDYASIVAATNPKFIRCYVLEVFVLQKSL
ncbi:hypothetical protein Tco_1350641 [Tanacetum coccineum]